MENYYSFKYLEKVIDPKAKKEFDYIIKGYNGDDHYYVMTIIPLDNAPEMSEEFTIVYENTKKLIIDVSSKLSESMLAKSKDKTANGSKNIYKSFFKTRYKIEGSNYYLLYSREETGFEKIEKNRTKKVEVLNNFITTNFSLQKFSFDDSDVFKDKTLFNKSNKIITNYWETSGITSTDEEEAIIKTLELRP